MSRGVNKVILIGNLGQDPETRYLPNGAAVTNLTLATSESWKDKETGEQREKTEWHRVKFFGRLAEIAGEYLKKGSKVYIEGSLETRQWEKDGQNHYTTEIKAREMQMLDGRGDQDNARSHNYARQESAANGGPPATPPKDDSFDDDIPF